MQVRIESYAFIGLATRASGPTAQVWLPPGFTLTGGGAYDMGHGTSNVLGACYPTRNREGQYTGWAATGRDTGQAEPSPLAVYAIGIRITRGGVALPVEQQVFCASSALAADPGVSVKLAPGWIGTGGGAQDNCASSASGAMLTASQPLFDASGAIAGWSAAGKHGGEGQPARVSAFVIGIRTGPEVTLAAKIVASSSLKTRYPSAMVDVPEGAAVLAGGGALCGDGGRASLLTASCPVISGRDGRLSGWFAAHKLQGATPLDAITAFGVLLQAS